MALEILLVEDDDDDAKLLQDTLLATNQNLRVHRVSDGVEAMAFLRYQKPYLDAPRPDIILLDLNMPRMDGREVMAKVKDDPWLKTIPIIVLTSSQAEADIAQSYKLLANCYIAKPGELGAFEKLVKNLNDFWLTNVLFHKAATSPD